MELLKGNSILDLLDEYAFQSVLPKGANGDVIGEEDVGFLDFGY